ncbi:MAG: hypothetical protein ACRDBY_14040 [Cetobacterium sp.]
MNSKEILENLKNGHIFTEGLSLEEYIDGVVTRYFRMYGVILNKFDYDTIVLSLKEKGII